MITRGTGGGRKVTVMNDSTHSTTQDNSGSYDSTEDQATASGDNLIDATVDYVSDQKGNPTNNTVADDDPNKSGGRSSIGVDAGLYSGNPTDSKTNVEIETNKDNQVTSVKTDNEDVATVTGGGGELNNNTPSKTETAAANAAAAASGGAGGAGGAGGGSSSGGGGLLEAVVSFLVSLVSSLFGGQ